MIKLQHTIIVLMAESHSSAALILPSLPSILSTSENTRVGAVSALAEQYQRMAQASSLDTTMSGGLKEDDHARNTSGSRNVMQHYPKTPMRSIQSQSPAGWPKLLKREQSKGLLGKLLGMTNDSSSGEYRGNYYGTPQQHGYYGTPEAPSQQQYGTFPQQGYQSQGYGQSEYVPQPSHSGAYVECRACVTNQHSQKGGIGAIGRGTALGISGGLIGGMLLEDAIQEGNKNDYSQGDSRFIPPLGCNRHTDLCSD